MGSRALFTKGRNKTAHGAFAGARYNGAIKTTPERDDARVSG
jgi:hypothetical protein